MIGVRDQAATTVALLTLVVVAWWSPWSGAPSPDAEFRITTTWRDGEADLSDFEPTTPRGLAAALLVHLDDQDVVRVDGTAGDGTIDASVDLTDPSVSSYFVHVWTPAWPNRLPPHCQRTAEVCRTLDDGTVVSVKIGRWGGSRGPKVTGFAYRKDSTVLVMAYGSGAGAMPVVDTVAEILSDPSVDWETVRAMNRAGEALDDFEEMELQLEVSEVKSSARPGAGLRSSGS